MKPIVSALNAQFGVDAVGKRIFMRLHTQGVLQWHESRDPVYVEA